jgi:tetratricopeptide (TPR) repeat protein
MFTPSVGLCVIIALSLHRIVSALAGSFGAAPSVRGRVFAAAMAALIAFYAYVTHGRMGIWEDGGHLYSYSAAVEPMNPMSHYSAGQYFARTGSEPKKFAFYEASLETFRAFQDQPHLFDERSVDAFSVVATEIAHRDLARDPERAIALADVAIDQFDRLVEMRAGRVDSNATAPYYVKATALLHLGRREESLAACRAGLAIAPHRGLAQLLRSLQSSER